MVNSSDRSQTKTLAGALCDVRTGVWFWMVFGAVAIALRGVRWDEDYEWAQIISGMVEYPEGHPLLRWIGGHASIQLYSTALLMQVTPNPAVICAVRNLLFIWATVVPVFLLGSAVSRKAIVGHIAAVMILLGVHLEFDGAYPQFLWPGMFSNGHVGTGYALLWLSAVAFGRVRLAALMLGLMPAIHMGQVPPCLLFAGIWSVWCLRRRPGLLLRAVPLFGLGIVLSATFFLVQRGYAVPVPDHGAYASTANARIIWEGSITHHDMHRSLPQGNGHLIVAGFVLLTWLLWRSGTLRRQEFNRVLTVCLAFGTGVIAIVYGVMFCQLLLGEMTPYLFLGWLPYRLANLIPPLFVVLLLTVAMQGESERRYVGFVSALLVAAILQPVAPLVFGESIATRYLSATDWITFVLFGALWTRLSAGEGKLDTVALATGAASLTLLAVFHQFGAACVLLGGVAAWALASMGGGRKEENSLWSVPNSVQSDTPAGTRWAVLIPSLLCAIAVLLILRTEQINAKHLPRGDFETGLSNYFADQGIDQTFLVVPPYQVLMQAQTGQPVMTDLAMTYFIGYMPTLGPSVQKMYTDIYGIDFTQPLTPGDSADHWTAIWEDRKKSEWQRLAHEYDFDFVIAPSNVSLRLRPVLSGELDTCYAIGGGPEAWARSAPAVSLASGASQ